MSGPVKAGLGCFGGGVVALVVVLVSFIGAVTGGAAGHQQAAQGATGAQPASRAAVEDIPPEMLALYQQAAPTCPGLDWTVLAAIGKVETDHGRHPTMRSSAGAVGPMQFLPSTFKSYAHPVPPGGKNPPTPWDPVDAVYAAARMLCANGARDGADVSKAIFAYNHADWYVRKVLAQAAAYAAGGQQQPPPGDGAALGTRGEKALAFAGAQLGKPYVWGATGPDSYDCSGLTQAAWNAAGISIPRTSQVQHTAGRAVPPGQMRPGDLIVINNDGNWGHVGMYMGGNLMVHAPKPGKSVEETDLGYWRQFPWSVRRVA
ncbi:bifunctional lytic transglycosylase/C40 family peptidase [Streptomyces sp. NPDC050315]|uniref:C40 family peptidase n=1 Tax=Streptomyces sp. NPDC050315 TaxID=3155039 RepID=UPI003449E0E0